MSKPVIVSACRTAVGEFGGALSQIPADELGRHVMLEAISRAGIEKDIVDEVIMGCVLPAGLGQNPARQAMLKAGLDYNVGALTVNKVCGSGLKAVMLAAQAIQAGDADCVVAGGMENMNLAPYYMLKGRTGMRMGHGQLIDGMIYDGLWDHINDMHMGMSAEKCAEKYGVTREDQDQFAFESYEKTIKSQTEGLFDEEITPYVIKTRKGEVVFDKDETPRPTSLETLAKFRPAFKKDGTVTAGNASKINDGASAVVVMSEERAKEVGAKPMARIVAQGAAGLDPNYVLVAPIYSIPKVCAKAGMEIKDIELQEVNEAFASSTVAVQRELNIDPARLNVHGGAIAIGHPIGASGGRVLTTLLYAMKKRNAATGMASLCLGGGESVSMIVEAV